MKLQSRVFFRTILDACSWRKHLSLHLLGSSIWYSPLPVEKMRTNYEFHQLKNKVKCGNNSSRWRNGTRACQRSSCPLTIPPLTLLPVFCEPSVSSGMLLSLIWLVKVSHRAKNSVTKTSQNLFFIILWQIAVDFSVWGVVGGGGRCWLQAVSQWIIYSNLIIGIKN